MRRKPSGAGSSAPAAAVVSASFSKPVDISDANPFGAFVQPDAAPPLVAPAQPPQSVVRSDLLGALDGTNKYSILLYTMAMSLCDCTYTLCSC